MMKYSTMFCLGWQAKLLYHYVWSTFRKDLWETTYQTLYVLGKQKEKW